MSDRSRREEPTEIPPQHQERQPGIESEMEPRPRSKDPTERGCDRLVGRRALISGGDSGIGRAVAIAFAREGADVAIVYLDEHEDAEETKRLVEEEGRRCVPISGDIGDAEFCREAVERTVAELGGLDVLVNNAAEQHVRERFEEVPVEAFDRTFRTNILSMHYMIKFALPHLEKGDSIVNTTSVTAYRGHDTLVDYASTKGAIVALTRSLALHLAERGIRVNGVAPGPIWTPLIPASFPEEKVEDFGQKEPLGRAGQPEEVAPCYVFLASADASYMTGQVLHPNGGEIING